ncbi:sensor histidine kinase [Paenibacillus piri]|uniref:histidine kinase n=1 Tax=Paenibacillus piri TaxID=2547395 RepID=A0A4R5KPJ2_9BACL|nr:HAMP domain-containing sensor histidine kinase [Paenibacillus piri]TDF97496.1 HAMP domain-containing histidine kinase [Paenibacillus piri]
MSHDNNGKMDIFHNELQFLEAARGILDHREQYVDNELLPHYEQLLHEYESLVRLTTKIFRISDLQSENVKRQETEIRRYNDHLQQMETSRRQLLTDISHELGTPMTSIQGYLRAMLDNIIEPNAKYLQMIYNKTVLINQLVEDLFEISKLEMNQTKMEFIDIPVDDLLIMFRHKFELEINDRGYLFAMEPLQGLPALQRAVVSVDTVRIEQVMNNLISNAFKYTPPGGLIKFQCEVDAEQSVCTVKVCDSGPGIDESSLPNVFDRFYRGDKSRQKQPPDGSGLGLAIAHEIIKKHNGRMGVDSKMGEGASFHFSLPIVIKQLGTG